MDMMWFLRQLFSRREQNQVRPTYFLKLSSHFALQRRDLLTDRSVIFTLVASHGNIVVKATHSDHNQRSDFPYGTTRVDTNLTDSERRRRPWSYQIELKIQGDLLRALGSAVGG